MLSVDPEKAFDKIEHPSMISVLHKLVKEGSFLNVLMNS
jgi:hypothetical protein